MSNEVISTYQSIASEEKVCTYVCIYVYGKEVVGNLVREVSRPAELEYSGSTECKQDQEAGGFVVLMSVLICYFICMYNRA